MTTDNEKVLETKVGQNALLQRDPYADSYDVSYQTRDRRWYTHNQRSTAAYSSELF